jgi:hypothetical protein
VNTRRKHSRGSEIDRETGRRRSALLIVLGVLLCAEAVLMAVVVVWLVLQLLTSQPSSPAGGVAIIVLALIGALWVSLAAVGAMRRRSWMRGAAVSWQLVQGAVALGCFQGLYAEPVLGWVLLLPAIACILLVISPPVVAATRRAATH